MCIVHGSQMQTRLCELWRRKEVGTEWAAGLLLGLAPVYYTTPALVGGRWIIFATRSTCVIQQSWVGALNPFLIIFHAFFKGVYL